MNEVKMDIDLERALNGEFRRDNDNEKCEKNNKVMITKRTKVIHLTNKSILNGKTGDSIPKFTVSRRHSGNINYFSYYFNGAAQKELSNRFNCDNETFAIAVSEKTNSCAISFAESNKPYKRVKPSNLPKKQRIKLNEIFEKLSFNENDEISKSYSFKVKFYPNEKIALIDIENGLM